MCRGREARGRAGAGSRAKSRVEGGQEGGKSEASVRWGRVQRVSNYILYLCMRQGWRANLVMRMRRGSRGGGPLRDQWAPSGRKKGVTLTSYLNQIRIGLALSRSLLNSCEHVLQAVSQCTITEQTASSASSAKKSGGLRGQLGPIKC